MELNCYFNILEVSFMNTFRKILVLALFAMQLSSIQASKRARDEQGNDATTRASKCAKLESVSSSSSSSSSFSSFGLYSSSASSPSLSSSSSSSLSSSSSKIDVKKEARQALKGAIGQAKREIKSVEEAKRVKDNAQKRFDDAKTALDYAQQSVTNSEKVLDKANNVVCRHVITRWRDYITSGAAKKLGELRNLRILGKMAHQLHQEKKSVAEIVDILRGVPKSVEGHDILTKLYSKLNKNLVSCDALETVSKTEQFPWWNAVDEFFIIAVVDGLNLFTTPDLKNQPTSFLKKMSDDFKSRYLCTGKIYKSLGSNNNDEKSIAEKMVAKWLVWLEYHNDPAALQQILKGDNWSPGTNNRIRIEYCLATGRYLDDKTDIININHMLLNDVNKTYTHYKKSGFKKLEISGLPYLTSLEGLPDEQSLEIIKINHCGLKALNYHTIRSFMLRSSFPNLKVLDLSDNKIEELGKNWDIRLPKGCRVILRNNPCSEGKAPSACEYERTVEEYEHKYEGLAEVD
jgi:hypothetical protein